MADGEVVATDEMVLFPFILSFFQKYYCILSDKAMHDKIGTGEGVGYNINIPIEYIDINADIQDIDSIGDEDYHFIFESVVLPVATEFSPELILVAAGFDAGYGDSRYSIGTVFRILISLQDDN